MACNFGFIKVDMVRVGVQDTKNKETDRPLLEPLCFGYSSQSDVMSWGWNANLECLFFPQLPSTVFP